MEQLSLTIVCLVVLFLLLGSGVWIGLQTPADRAPVRFQLQLHKVLWGNEPGR